MSVSGERNANLLKLTHPKLFVDVCYRHASHLLGITNMDQVADLLGDVQGPPVESSASYTPGTSAKKQHRGSSPCFVSFRIHL